MEKTVFCDRCGAFWTQKLPDHFQGGHVPCEDEFDGMALCPSCQYPVVLKK